MLRILDLFSGIGGFSLGLERAGMRTVAFCEIDPFCRQVLAKRWPDVACHDDVSTMQFSEGMADVVCGGFPCQDVSLAGKRAGLSGKRSGLYRELVRAIRVVRPHHAIMENVAALLSDGMGTVLGDLAESGLDLEWDCIPANAIGAPHERDRVWIVAHANREGRPQSPLSGNEFRVRPGDCPEALSATEDASDASREQVGPAGQSRIDGGLVPTDSFAWIRRKAERTRADPYGARLAFREGFTGNAWEELSTAQRNAIEDERQSVWPDEPALSGMDDGIPDWMDRVKATGNAVVPQIPEMIGRAIIDGESRC
jgi:DNA (cytosine-5)-methyltransferase 1